AAGGRDGAAGAGGSPAAGTGGGAVASGGATGGGGKGGVAGGAGGTATATGGIIGSGGRASGSGGAGAAGMSGTAGAGGAPGDPAQLNFETSSQNWVVAAGSFTNLGRSTARQFAGIASPGATLQYTASSTGVTNAFTVGNLGSITPPGPGSVITFHIYLPATAPAIDWVQPFMQDSTLAYFGAYTGR